MKYYLSLLLIPLLFATSIEAQSSALAGKEKIDSLLTELPKAKGDTNEVNLLQILSFTYYSIDPDEGLKYAERGIELARKINWKPGISKCFNSLGAINMGKSNYKQALINYQKSLKMSKELNDRQGISKNLGNIGNIYFYQSDYFNAIKHYKKALEMAIELKDTMSMATNYGNIGVVSYSQSNFPLALECYQKALKLNEYLKNKGGVARDYGNIAIVYLELNNFPLALENYQKALELNYELGDKSGIARNLGNIGLLYRSEKKYDLGEETFKKALNLYRELGDKVGISRNLRNLGILYFQKSDFPRAYENFNEALKLSEEIGQESGIAYSYLNLGEFYLRIAQDSVRKKLLSESNYTSLNTELNLNKSIDYSLKANRLFQKLGKLNELSDTYNNLHLAYYQKGMFKNSIESLRKFKELQDSVYSEENRNKIAAIEQAREDDVNRLTIAKQKVEIEAQKKERNYIIYSAAGGIATVLLILGVIFNQRRKADKLLHNVLPISIAKRLKQKEHPISDYFAQASIIFIDIVNFTELARDEDPRRIVESLNKIFTHFDSIANKYGLEKIKTIGDSYMAAAGIPEIQHDNTFRAAQMAIEVKELMSNYYTEDGTKIEVRIGIDCGPVVAGVIGENKFIYDMWSDAVNTASRMESSSISGHIQVSERFKTSLVEHNDFTYIERGEIEIKGKGVMKTYFMEGRLIAAT